MIGIRIGKFNLVEFQIMWLRLYAAIVQRYI